MVIDSHVLLWWLEDSEMLSDTARMILDQAQERGERHQVCAVTFWEIGCKEFREQLRPRIAVKAWAALLRDLGWVDIIETSAVIWLSAAQLNWQHRDPADRIIAVTALKYNVAVLTKDRRFHESDSPVKAIW
jgi:PIN domain nuclease of toxin-antitoxin system